MIRLLLALLIAASAFAADISGKWTFNVETDMGSGTPTFEFKQDGSTLSGTYRGLFGEAPVTGKLDGDKAEFWFEGSPGGEKMTIKFSGVVEGSDQMNGTVDYGGQFSGKFTAKKQ
jgi:hypothetical protein